MPHTPFIPLAHRAAISAAAALLATVLVVSASCASSQKVEFVRDGDTYTMAEALETGRSADLSSVKDVTVDEAPEARQRALIALRGQGADGGRIADILTEGFPTTTRSVPVRVEDATVDGLDRWIVVEAWGGKDGRLVHRRVWVFGQQDGELVESASFR